MSPEFALRPSDARAPAAQPASPLRPSAPGRARPGLEEEGRPAWMERMAIPLNGLPDSLLAELDRLGPGYEGWGRDEDWTWFVDVGGRRFTGRTFRRAIAAARAESLASGGEEGNPS